MLQHNVKLTLLLAIYYRVMTDQDWATPVSYTAVHPEDTWGSIRGAIDAGFL